MLQTYTSPNIEFLLNVYRNNREVYKTVYIFIKKGEQRFVYICTPHQARKKNYNLKKKGKGSRELRE